MGTLCVLTLMSLGLAFLGFTLEHGKIFLTGILLFIVFGVLMTLITPSEIVCEKYTVKQEGGISYIFDGSEFIKIQKHVEESLKPGDTVISSQNVYFDGSKDSRKYKLDDAKRAD